MNTDEFKLLHLYFAITIFYQPNLCLSVFICGSYLSLNFE